MLEKYDFINLNLEEFYKSETIKFIHLLLPLEEKCSAIID